MKDKLFYLIVMGLLWAYIAVGESTQPMEVVVEEDYYESPVEKVASVTATVYNPVEEQCDSDPLTTADNSKIDLEKLRKGELKWIAVSRDLLEQGFTYGDTVEVICYDNLEISGNYVIHDTMNKRFTSRIDILTTDTLGKWEDVDIVKYKEGC